MITEIAPNVVIKVDAQRGFATARAISVIIGVADVLDDHRNHSCARLEARTGPLSGHFCDLNDQRDRTRREASSRCRGVSSDSRSVRHRQRASYRLNSSGHT